MTDRELLELAAKAAGLELDKFSYTDRADLAQNSFTAKNYIGRWNPLTDDGDALRLAHKLGLLSDVPVWPRTLEETRRAIVRAAAEIGRNMK